jgi:hypothetical protein
MAAYIDGQPGASAVRAVRTDADEGLDKARLRRRQAGKARELLELVRQKQSAAILATLAGELEEDAAKLEAAGKPAIP